MVLDDELLAPSAGKVIVTFTMSPGLRPLTICERALPLRPTTTGVTTVLPFLTNWTLALLPLPVIA